MKFRLTNDKFIEILEASQHEYRVIRHHFKAEHKGVKFQKYRKKGAYRANGWDGVFDFVKKQKFIPFGFWQELVLLGKEMNSAVEIENFETMFNTHKLSFDKFMKWVDTYFNDELGLYPRDYQIEAAYKILFAKRSVGELCTGAGKSLVIFMVFSYLLTTEPNHRFLLIVPSISLVTQAISDFTEYNGLLNKKINLRFQELGDSAKPRSDISTCNVVVGTYQSLSSPDSKFFQILEANHKTTYDSFIKSFTIVGCDETHTVKCTSIQKILELTIAEQRFGVTGTIPSDKLENFTILKELGPCVIKITANQLIEQNHISDIEINILKIKWGNNEILSNLYDALTNPNIEGAQVLGFEKRMIQASKQRLQFIKNLAQKMQNTSLILFQHIEYGNLLYDTLKANMKIPVLYIDGSVDKDTREYIRQHLETDGDKILIASFGTFSTGINVKNIHNIIFTESYKSEIIVQQSIGRGLRKHKDKDKLRLFDIVDDLSSCGATNFSLKHSAERIKIYNDKKFKHKTYNFNLNETYPEY